MLCNWYHHKYISWKYWHAKKRCVDALYMVVVYDQYKECVNKWLAIEVFEVEKDKLKVIYFHTFLMILSRKGLAYKVDSIQNPCHKFMQRSTPFNIQCILSMLALPIFATPKNKLVSTLLITVYLKLFTDLSHPR